MSVHDEGIERIIAWLRTQEAEEVKPAITALRELQTLRRNSDKYDPLLSEVKAAMEKIEKTGQDKWKEYKQNHTGSYDEGYSDGVDYCADIIRKHIKEVE